MGKKKRKSHDTRLDLIFSNRGCFWQKRGLEGLGASRGSKYIVDSEDSGSANVRFIGPRAAIPNPQEKGIKNGSRSVGRELYHPKH